MTRWLQLSLAAGVLFSLVLVPALGAKEPTPFQKQLDFGADMAKRGLWKEALFRFQQADRLQPGNSHVLNNIAVAYEALGLFDKALDAYQQALKAGPQEKELRANYSRFLEFYQSFRIEEPGPGDAGSAVATETSE